VKARYRRRTGFAWWQLLLLLIGVIAIFGAWQQFVGPNRSPLEPLIPADMTPTLPEHLTSRDVLPTLTPVPNAPIRQIIFASAHVDAPIVPAVRSGASWEVRYLGDSVGHLEGTGWLNDPAGNIVLAGHVEDAKGQPGPFAQLSLSAPGDTVILREGSKENLYRVVSVNQAAPDDMHYVAQDGHRRLTLITCIDYDFKDGIYQKRLVVVAEPSTVKK